MKSVTKIEAIKHGWVSDFEQEPEEAAKGRKENAGTLKAFHERDEIELRELHNTRTANLQTDDKNGLKRRPVKNVKDKGKFEFTI